MGQLSLPLEYPPDPLLEAVRRRRFPAIDGPIVVEVSGRGTLAYIESGGSIAPRVIAHAILNDAHVPAWVRAFVYTHELLHLEVRPRQIGKRLVDHPPEFWAREAELCPERDQAWRWIWANLGECLLKRPRLECIQVTGRWKAVRDEMRLRFAKG